MYDTGNRKSYVGEPTVNTAGTTGIANSWNNSGTAAWSSDDTNVSRLFTNLPVFSMDKLTAGNSHIGIGSTSATVSTEYTYSVYVWIPSSNSVNMAGNSPYFRPQPANAGVGSLTYDGSSAWGTWPRDQWVRVSITATTQATNVTSAYISCYLDTAGDKIYFTAPQFEQKGHATPFVNGTRSATQGLIDRTNNTTIDISNASFDSNAQMTFDGTDDYINAAAFDMGTPTGITLECFIRFNGSLDSADRKVMHYNKTGGTNAVFQLRKGDSINRLMYQAHNGSQWYTMTDTDAVESDTWAHFMITHSGTSAIMYKNGVQSATATMGNLHWTNANNLLIGYRANSEYWKGDISIMKIYDRALTSAEVLQNFNAIKSRFGL
tara:strand:- start:4 stop:1137 length:1134 start_codon:yes stop_codon:yes gene_type:complete